MEAPSQLTMAPTVAQAGATSLSSIRPWAGVAV